MRLSLANSQLSATQRTATFRFLASRHKQSLLPSERKPFSGRLVISATGVMNTDGCVQYTGTKGVVIHVICAHTDAMATFTQPDEDLDRACRWTEGNFYSLVDHLIMQMYVHLKRHELEQLKTQSYQLLRGASAIQMKPA